MRNTHPNRKALRRAGFCALALCLLLPVQGLSAQSHNTPPPGTPEPIVPGAAGTVIPFSERGDLLSIEVSDAYYDGRTLSMKWWVRNISPEPLYLLLDTQTVNGIPLETNSIYNPNRVLMPPGAVAFGDIEAALATPDTGGTGVVTLAYLVMRPIVPVTETASSFDEIRAVNERDEIAVLLDGSLALPVGDKLLDSSLPYAEALVEAGVMERAGGMEIGFLLNRSPLPRTALPDGQPLTFSLPGYELRLTRADFTPYAGYIDFELVFADREAMERFADYFPREGEDYPDKYWDYRFQDENGSEEWNGVYSVNHLEPPVEQPDGTWVLPRNHTFSEITRLPDQLTLMPYREQASGLANRPPFPEEAVVLTFSGASE